MLTIVAGTNRKGSNTGIIAKEIQTIFQAKTTEEVVLIDIQDLPADWIYTSMYAADNQANSIRQLQENYFFKSDRVLYIMPEYNGSFPGIMKLFLDALSVYEYAKTFKGKKAAMIGVATGRAGNLQGMEHFTGVLNHVGSIVFPNKLPLSSVGGILEENKITDEATRAVLEKFAEEFLAF